MTSSDAETDLKPIIIIIIIIIIVLDLSDCISISACGGHLNVTSPGSFRSLDYDEDGHYENNLDCVWTIEAPEGMQIRLQFASFHLHNGSSGGNCTDFVEAS